MHTPGSRQVPSHPTHSTHASAISEVRSTRRTAAAAGIKGHCTRGHHSRQRGESGDAVRDGATQGVGGQGQEPAPRAAHTHTRVQAGALTPHTQHSCISDMRGEEHQEQSSGQQRALHCTHGHHSRQRGESGHAVRDGATQGVGVQVQLPAPKGNTCTHTRVQAGALTPQHTALMPPRYAR